MKNISEEFKKIESEYSDVEIVDSQVYVRDFENDEEISNFGYMFWWDVENEECGIEYQKIPGSSEHDEPCRTAEDFIEYIKTNI
jgi:hypothetical protein